MTNRVKFEFEFREVAALIEFHWMFEQWQNLMKVRKGDDLIQSVFRVKIFGWMLGRKIRTLPSAKKWVNSCELLCFIAFFQFLANEDGDARVKVDEFPFCGFATYTILLIFDFGQDKKVSASKYSCKWKWMRRKVSLMTHFGFFVLQDSNAKRKIGNEVIENFLMRRDWLIKP